MAPEWDSLRVRRINLGATTVGLAMRTSADVVELEVENSGPPLTLQFRPGLANETRVDRVEVSDGSHPGTGAESGSAYEVSVLCPAGRTTRITLHLTRRDATGDGCPREAQVRKRVCLTVMMDFVHRVLTGVP
jgi:hypothetical protein